MTALANQWAGLSDMFDQMNRMQRQLDRLLEHGGAGPLQFPPVNIYANDDGAMITAELPGVDPNDLDISAMQNTLTITGERSIAQPAQGQTWHRRERGEGRFARTIQMPFAIDPDSVAARCRDGVLEVRVARPEEAKPRKIAVKSQ